MNNFKKILIAGMSIVFIIVFSSAAETKSAELGKSTSASNDDSNEFDAQGIPAKRLHAACPQGMRFFSEAWVVLGPSDVMLEEGRSCAQQAFDWSQWRRFTSPWK